MHSPEEVFQEIESDRAVREAELRLIENLLAKTPDEVERKMLRRSLVLLAYSHVEGFCKFSLITYVRAVNSLNLPCARATPPLVALTLSRVFAALRDVNSKHQYFARSLSEDKDLHRLERERVFIERYEEIVENQVQIQDDVIDTKSNLNSVVMKRNLYQVGLGYRVLGEHGSTLDMLLGVRNAIAHGDSIKDPKPNEIQTYVSLSFKLMGFVQLEIYEALRNKAYQRNAA